LETLNRLSNRDRHEKLPVIVPGLQDPRIRYTLDGLAHDNPIRIKEGGDWLDNEAEITRVAKNAMDVRIEGTPFVVLGTGEYRLHPVKQPAYLALVPSLSAIADFVWQQVIPALSRHTRR